MTPKKAKRLERSWAEVFRNEALPLIDEERFTLPQAGEGFLRTNQSCTTMPTLPWQGVFAITGKLTLHLGVEAEVRRVVTCRLAVMRRPKRRCSWCYDLQGDIAKVCCAASLCSIGLGNSFLSVRQ